MPEWFPLLHEDELLYSVVARYCRAMGTRSTRDIMTDLFGYSSVIAVVDLPCNLDALLGRLVPGHPLTAEGVIARHTLLPFYAAFLSVDRVADAVTLMRSAGGRSLHTVVGAASRIGAVRPAGLQYCPRCVKADRRRVGEGYWRRSHQLPGSYVCAEHGIPLRISGAGWRVGRERLAFTALDETVTPTDRLVVLPAAPRAQLRKLAESGAWLLSAGMDLPRGDLLDRYRAFLGDDPTLLRGRGMRHQALVARVRRCFGRPLLAALGRGLSDVEGWAFRLLGGYMLGHPLQHLVLVHTLAGDAEQFFSRDYTAERLEHAEAHARAAEGPCGNPVCQRFAWRRPPVSSGESGQGRRRDTPGNTVPEKRIVTCPRCKFSYIYPKRYWILAYGGAWEKELGRLLANPSVSLEECGRRLCVSPLTVKAQALRLNMARAEWKTDSQRWAARRSRAQVGDEVREQQRLAFEATMESSRDPTRTAIRARCTAAYDWLLANDREWLKDRLPVRSHRQVSDELKSRTPDWPQIDRDLQRQLKAAYRTLLTRRPLRKITVTSLANAVGAGKAFERRLVDLPRVAAFLTSVVESRETYARRRLRVVGDQSIADGRAPVRSALIGRAGLHLLQDALSDDIDREMERIARRIRAGNVSRGVQRIS